MYTYDRLIHLLDDVQIVYEHQPIEYQPQHCVIHSGEYRSFIKNRENESNILGVVYRTPLEKLCYNAK